MRQEFAINADDVVRVSTCKAMPDQPFRMLVAWVSQRRDAAADEAAQLRLAIFDPRSAKVLSRRVEDVFEDSMTEFKEGSLAFDTGRYFLTPGIRAFGLVTRLQDRASCAGGGLDRNLTLYVAQGASIRPVLTQIALQYWAYPAGECGGEIEREASLTLAVTPRAGPHWADILVVGKATDQRRRFTYRLTFDGTAYPTEELQTNFFRWWWH